MSEETTLSPAEAAKELPERERRQAVRCRCTLSTAGRAFGKETNETWTGTVHDISVKGLRLIINASPKPGTFLDITLQNPTGPGLSRPLLVRVRRVTSQPDGNWIVGCTFVKRLSRGELQVLLESVAAATV